MGPLGEGVARPPAGFPALTDVPPGAELSPSSAHGSRLNLAASHALPGGAAADSLVDLLHAPRCFHLSSRRLVSVAGS